MQEGSYYVTFLKTERKVNPFTVNAHKYPALFIYYANSGIILEYFWNILEYSGICIIDYFRIAIPELVILELFRNCYFRISTWQ
jgi:hypothetical protein